MDVLQAITSRRATRNYLPTPVDEALIRQLLGYATRAPSAVNHQPWAFIVVEDADLLKAISEEAKRLMRSDPTSPLAQHILNELYAEEFNIFYNAGTLVLICAKPEGEHPDWDCCFAAENLMLAAAALGLATCPVGFAWGALKQPEIKRRLGIPSDYFVVLPILVGYPAETPRPVSRHPAEILAWHRPKAPVAK